MHAHAQFICNREMYQTRFMWLRRRASMHVAAGTVHVPPRKCPHRQGSEKPIQSVLSLLLAGCPSPALVPIPPPAFALPIRGARQFGSLERSLFRRLGIIVCTTTTPKDGFVSMKFVLKAENLPLPKACDAIVHGAPTEESALVTQ